MWPWERHWVDYYDLLEVKPTASAEVIEAAYKRLARMHHSDVGGDDDHMRSLNEASELLRNAASRQEYDKAYRAQSQADEIRRQEQLRDAQHRAEEAERQLREAQAQARRARHEAGTRGHPQQHASPPSPSPDDSAGSGEAADGAGSTLGRLIGEVAGGLTRSWLEARSAERDRSGSLVGLWDGSDGNRYVLNQRGPVLLVQGMNPLGVLVLQGQGAIQGDLVRLQFRNANGTYGTAEFRLSPDGQSLAGHAVTLPLGWSAPVQLWRLAGGDR